MTKRGYVIESLDGFCSLEEWDSFVDESPQGCIFCHSWWLRAVCQDDFRIMVARKGGRIVAGMPMPARRRFGRMIVTMPRLTQTLGVLLARPTKTSYQGILADEIAAVSALVEAVPEFDYFSMQFHHGYTNWLPFYWAGYQQTTRYTYVIPDVGDIRRVYAGLSPEVRTEIRKASRLGISVSMTDDVGVLLEMVGRTFARQGLRVPFSQAVLGRLDSACKARDARRIIVARDPAGRVHSALYVVHDRKSMYYLLQGGDPELRSSGANPLAVWRSIELAGEVTRTYDFEGSMLPGVEFFCRSFGAVQTPYFTITKSRLPGIEQASLRLPWLRGLLRKLAGTR